MSSTFTKTKKKPALTVESNLNKHKAAVSAMVQETKEQQIHKKKTTTTTTIIIFKKKKNNNNNNKLEMKASGSQVSSERGG